ESCAQAGYASASSTIATPVFTAFLSHKSYLFVQRKLADAFSRSGENRVGERWRRRRHGWLADPSYLAAELQAFHHDFRRLIQTHAFVNVEVGLLRSVVLVGQFAVHGMAETPDRAAHQLRFEIDGIDDPADVANHIDPLDFDSLRRVVDLHHLRDRHPE